MKLLLDLGNSRLKWALYDGQSLSPMQAIAVGESLRLPVADAAILASSSSAMGSLDWLDAALAQVGIRRVERLGPASSDALLSLAYAQPATLGVDRWLAMRAARRAAPGPFVVASVGTALTVDAVDASGRHLGGCIAPGPQLMREALLARAPHLDVAGGELHEFPASTPDALRSGPLLAAAALVERLHAGLLASTSSEPRLLLTGGGAPALLPALRPTVEWVPDLVLRGMLTLSAATG